MIQVPSAETGRRSAGASEFAIDLDQVNQRPPSAKLNQTDGVVSTLDRTSEDAAVELKHSVQIDCPQDQVIDFAYLDH